jgi:hypothetical protein
VFDAELSSSDSDSEDLTRYAALSPKIRNYARNGYNSSSHNELLIKSHVQLDETPIYVKPFNRLSKFAYVDTESGATQNHETTETDDSDEEFSQLEKGIQISLEKVTNRLRGANNNKYDAHTPSISGYSAKMF